MQQGLKIASYNIQHGTNGARIIENIKGLAAAGVSLFCLQEVRYHPNRPFIVDLLLRELGAQWKAEYLISSGSFDLGLCTIWHSGRIKAVNFDSVFLPKLTEIKLYEKVYLKFHRKWEKVDSHNIAPETKAALIGRFEFNGQGLRITNTHLDWLGGSRQRLGQLEHIQHKLSVSQPCLCEILCGDFNTLGYYKFSKKIKNKIDALLNEEYLSVFKNVPTTKSWQMLDHILVKNLQVAHSQILKLKGSDHYPLLAEVQI